MRSFFVNKNRVWKESDLLVTIFYNIYSWYSISFNVFKAIASKIRGINQQTFKEKGHGFEWREQPERYIA